MTVMSQMGNLLQYRDFCEAGFVMEELEQHLLDAQDRHLSDGFKISSIQARDYTGIT